MTSFFGSFTRNNLKPYFGKPFLKLVMETPAEQVDIDFNVIESIRKHIAQLKPIATKQGLICIGDYAPKILLKKPIDEKTSQITPIFIHKASKESLRLTQTVAKSEQILNIDADIDAHFWFNVNSYFAKNEEATTRLRNLTAELHEAIIFASLWEGLSSALLPMLTSQFASSNVASVALTVLPSKAQPADSQFNALACISMCMSNEPSPIILLSRDSVEEYVGVDRNGSLLNGNIVINYLLEIMIAKDTFTQELRELSRAFNVKPYTALSITGASFKIYGSFESMLVAISMKPLLQFDMASSSVLYVLVRAPFNLKDKLSKGKIELAIANWSKSTPNIKSIYVSEPIYVDDASDRIDIIVLAGGFDLSGLIGYLHKKSSRVKNEIVKKGLFKEKEWEAVVKSLTIND